jgi:type IV pilus assembly protein PilA
MFKTIHNMKKRDERGFTLVELLIVIAIIAILAAIAIPQFAAYRQRGVRASMVSDAKNIATMLEATFADTQSYPSLTATAAGGTFTIGTQTGRMSTGNVGSVTGGTASYTIVVNNGAGGTGSDDYSLTSTGAFAWY